MSAKNGKMSAKQESAAALLALGRSVRHAAQEVGIAERTLSGWKHQETFKARVQDLRQELFSRTVGMLAGISVQAARTLGRLLRGADAKVQLGAARIVLEAGPRLRELTEIIDRLEALEKAQADRKRKLR